jgi:hypothetical protein
MLVLGIGLTMMTPIFEQKKNGESTLKYAYLPVLWNTYNGGGLPNVEQDRIALQGLGMLPTLRGQLNGTECELQVAAWDSNCSNPHNHIRQFHMTAPVCHLFKAGDQPSATILLLTLSTCLIT